MKFKHKATGIIEDVTNALLIPQYKKYSDIYEPVEGKVEDKPKKPTNAKK